MSTPEPAVLLLLAVAATVTVVPDADPECGIGPLALVAGRPASLRLEPPADRLAFRVDAPVELELDAWRPGATGLPDEAGRFRVAAAGCVTVAFEAPVERVVVGRAVDSPAPGGLP